MWNNYIFVWLYCTYLDQLASSKLVSKYALSQRRSLKKKGEIRSHWLEYAHPKYSEKITSDIRAFFIILVVYIPVPMFWALFKQQSSRFTFQATRMDGSFGENVVMQPDHTRAFNPFFGLLLIPFLNQFLYDVLEKIGLKGPIRKMICGGYIMACAFFIAAVLEYHLEKTYPILPKEGNGQLRIYNGLNCNFQLTINNKTEELSPLDIYTDRDISISGEKLIQISGNSVDNDCPEIKPTDLKVEEMKSISYFLKSSDLEDKYEFQRFEDDVDKSRTTFPIIRILSDVDNIEVEFRDKDNSEVELSINSSSSEKYEIFPGKYSVHIGEKKILDVENIKAGGVFAYIISKTQAIKQNVISEPNSVHMLWLVIPYFVMTVAEIMFSPTALEFSFSYAPKSMKSVIQAVYVFTVAIGDLIIIVVVGSSSFRQFYEFILFGSLMVVVITLFAIIAIFIKPQKPADEV